MHRLRIKIVGQSGSGLLSTGEIITKAFEEMGFNIVSDREYPSLIMGGHSCYTLNVSSQRITSLSREADIMIAIDKQSLEAYGHELKKGGVLIHGYEKPEGLKTILKHMKKHDLVAVHGREIAKENGGNALMVNVILAGVFWKVAGLDYKYVENEVKRQFASKPKILPLDLKCARAGYDAVQAKIKVQLPKKKPSKRRLILNGNQALALGAVHGGVRAYYAYPMSPSSSILSYMAQWSFKTGMVVKQAEDEITAAQMAVGSMYMGTRALVGTSGGGYDLMTETVSLAGMIEVPLVIIIAQRPGPATGLPTWTSQGDLKMAIHSGHGEYGKMVLSVSHPEDAFDLIQHALNYAEEYQMPVTVLTEKVIAESLFAIEPFKQKKIPIKRGLVPAKKLAKLDHHDRYRLTKSGVSLRWAPCTSPAYYFSNSDEHLENGELTEDEIPSQEMYAKRMRKLDTLEKALPEPELIGPAKAKISFIGWGSTKNTMMDIVDEYRSKGIAVNYLHYSYLYPLKVGKLQKFLKENRNVHLMEGNYTGQLGQMIEGKLGAKPFRGKFLRANGRPFFLEDVEKYIDKNL